jgi:hypothetical protein
MRCPPPRSRTSPSTLPHTSGTPRRAPRVACCTSRRRRCALPSRAWRTPRTARPVCACRPHRAYRRRRTRVRPGDPGEQGKGSELWGCTYGGRGAGAADVGGEGGEDRARLRRIFLSVPPLFCAHILPTSPFALPFPLPPCVSCPHIPSSLSVLKRIRQAHWPVDPPVRAQRRVPHLGVDMGLVFRLQIAACVRPMTRLGECVCPDTAQHPTPVIYSVRKSFTLFFRIFLRSQLFSACVCFYVLACCCVPPRILGHLALLF